MGNVGPGPAEARSVRGTVIARGIYRRVMNEGTGTLVRVVDH